MSAAPDSAAPPAWVTDLFRQADAARKGGRYALALATYRRVVAAAPEYPIALQHLGALLTVLGRCAEAEPILREALARNPDDASARHALATTLMGQGRFAESWRDYEARFEIPQLGCKKPTGFPFPEWRGEDLAGKRLLIFPEMGFGDQIQHARFAALLRERGAEVILLCRPELERLFVESLPGIQVLAAHGPLEFPDPDYWTMCASLPGLAGVTLETLPNAPYLRAPKSARRLPKGFKIGLMTAGDPVDANDAAPLLAPALADQLRESLPGEVIDLAPAATGAQDLADTAAIVARLDLVVSVDTAVAHLAGALGRPGFVLIPAVGADWRWMEAREDSPWYPSLRLFRADPRAGWAPALERLAGEGRALAEGASRGLHRGAIQAS
jgi:tetratricopeptide (TPR) repeat protein